MLASCSGTPDSAPRLLVTGSLDSTLRLWAGQSALGVSIVLGALFPFVTGSGCGTLVNLFLQDGDAEAGSGTGA